MQQLLVASDNYTELDDYFLKSGVSTFLLVCDVAIRYLNLDNYFHSLKERLGINVVRFSNLDPNPKYDSVVAGVKVYKAAHCEMITAVGGGSAIDVAKCIKLFCNMRDDEIYLKQCIEKNDIPLLAIPTTAGTGSEATKYAVIYYNDEKQSVMHDSCIPSTVLFDASTLKTLPLYQKKATMMDAFCHAIESFWSLNSTVESKEYSKQAIKLILDNMAGYLDNIEKCNENMLIAANISGKAINIAQTTAGHAMCYKLTSMYGIAHGHAAALCVAELFAFMLTHLDDCIDNRGCEYLKGILFSIAKSMNCDTAEEATKKFKEIVYLLDLKTPKINSVQDIALLKNSVNPVRLKNYPIKLSLEDIENLYDKILEIK